MDDDEVPLLVEDDSDVESNILEGEIHDNSGSEIEDDCIEETDDDEDDDLDDKEYGQDDELDQVSENLLPVAKKQKLDISAAKVFFWNQLIN